MGVRIKQADDVRHEEQGPAFMANRNWLRGVRVFDILSRALLAIALILAVALVYLLVQLFLGRADVVTTLPFAQGAVDALLWFSVLRGIHHIFETTVDSGTPFTKTVEESLNRIGMCLLLLAVAELVFQVMAQVIANGAAPSLIISWGYGSVVSDWMWRGFDASSQGAIVVSVGSFVAPGIVFVLAHVFGYGRFLLDEADHTL
ncbi:MAG: hypothetical protein DUD33_08505 [Coriobacteriaceae bacterium]|nr:MAG: hypothetical protein DUD33_08505 [Coriobacteriaceae bacterium]